MKIAIIPARGGSRRIPRKNIRTFHGKPIIAYSILAAIEFGFDAVYVSTDEPAIANVAGAYGALTMARPEPLAQDEVGTQEVMAHAVAELMNRDRAIGFTDQVCCIYPTAPLMRLVDLERGRWELAMRGGSFAMSVGTDPLRDAGQFYWGRAGSFSARVPLMQPGTIMIPVPETHVCDINTPQDWERAELMYAKLQGANSHATV
ncbi:MAG TPA: hypothetical protein VF151_10730 [Gemmatimonadales bacterium]